KRHAKGCPSSNGSGRGRNQSQHRPERRSLLVSMQADAARVGAYGAAARRNEPAAARHHADQPRAGTAHGLAGSADPGTPGARNRTFTGYSALAVALALPADGNLICCDVSEEWTRTAQRYWIEAGVADRIELRLAPAAETLAVLSAAGEDGHFDFAFIDADKENYDRYYEHCLKLVRPGGLIAVDNTLWHGSGADPAHEASDTGAIRALNRKVRDDPRVDMVLVPIGDGLLLARRRL